MYKKLFKQIWNEWRNNLWLGTELLFVSVLLWFLVDFLYVNISVYFQPLGFDVSHCYNVNLKWLAKGDPKYIPSDTIYQIQFDELVDRLRRRPDVEEVCISIYSYPYNPSNSWGELCFGKKGEIECNNVCRRYITPEFFKVFRFRGAKGETPEQLASIFASDPNGIIASDNCLPHKYHRKLTTLVGLPFMFMVNDTTDLHRLLAVYVPVRYSEFDDGYSQRSVTIHYDKGEYGSDTNVSLRVKDNMDVDFVNRIMKTADKQLRVGNMFVSSVVSFADIRNENLKFKRLEIRNYSIGIAFLLLNIFLGLLGTFWFRLQQRRSEIALQKALGSTKRNVFLRSIVEGLLILTIATIPAIIVDWNMAYAHLNAWMGGTTLAAGRFIATIFITWLLIALMIVLGTWLPARKAMRIQPAEALHED
jgi:putative ABC transport system permease protein